MIAALAAEIAEAFEAGDVAAARVAAEAIRALVEVENDGGVEGARGNVVELAVVRGTKDDSGR